MKCPSCKRPMVSKKTDYHYVDCGLKNIFLNGIEVKKCEECGEEEIVLPNLEELHSLIAHDIAMQPERLRPEEIRFLRTHLGFSGVDFAKLVSVTPESVSRWENDADRKMEPHTEKLLRLMILASMGPFRDYEEFKNFGLTNKKTPLKRSFKVSDKGWKQAA